MAKRVKIKNSATGEIKEISVDELATYGIDAETAVKSITSQKELDKISKSDLGDGTQDAVESLNEILNPKEGGATAENAKQLAEDWYKRNKPFFQGNDVDDKHIRAVIDNLPKGPEEVAAEEAAAQPQQQGGGFFSNLLKGGQQPQQEIPNFDTATPQAQQFTAQPQQQISPQDFKGQSVISRFTGGAINSLPSFRRGVTPESPAISAFKQKPLLKRLLGQ